MIGQGKSETATEVEPNVIIIIGETVPFIVHVLYEITGQQKN